jgi:very-short-patch-repair endonuclease
MRKITKDSVNAFMNAQKFRKSTSKFQREITVCVCVTLLIVSFKPPRQKMTGKCFKDI